MGHYASDYATEESSAVKRLRKRYYQRREQLEAIPLRLLTVGDLLKVLDLLNERNEPRDFSDEPSPEEKIREIEDMLGEIKGKARGSLKR